ncbi:MAG TPA: non-homologous end-joining DNA ligase [Chitinivibrionales bacterium]|nr:non-homologous end-joining DNA ligase [Chitinivibrionales bacterium]
MMLRQYTKKRKLAETPEPEPRRGKSWERHLVFVVHKHAARRLHYDLRMELGGALKSFAVPKGPSLDPSVKRLAVMVEDHPFDYKDFEGVIPEGNYGAGAVMIWDTGYYGHPLATTKSESERLILEGMKKGDIKFTAAGRKLKGEFALVKTRWDDKSWLLLKKKDRFVSSADVLKQDRSVVSNKTLEEISGDGRAAFSGRNTAGPSRGQNTSLAAEVKNGRSAAMPHHVRPMLAASVKKAFNHPEWIFEIKWDGYRAVAEIDRKKILLYSRNQLPLMDRYSPVVDSLRELRFEAVLDGEIVVLDKKGKPDFQMLQDYRKSPQGRLVYYVFDMLFYQGRDITGLPLYKRKDLLKSILPPLPHAVFCDHVWKDGVSFFEAAKKKGLEGIMAKNAQSAYRAGIRSRDWLKIKNRLEQDCVIAGFTGPRGSRTYIGSLVLGAFDHGTLVYVGHSGGGFGRENLKSLYERLQPLVQNKCPFSVTPPEETPVTWVKPVLVGEFAFTEWTKDNVMRQPVFIRFREDKSADEAVREPVRTGKERGQP